MDLVERVPLDVEWSGLAESNLGKRRLDSVHPDVREGVVVDIVTGCEFYPNRRSVPIGVGSRYPFRIDIVIIAVSDIKECVERDSQVRETRGSIQEDRGVP